jgi:REP element-mobilizing transposase RayT
MMTRPGRIHVEGGYYHVYNRLGRGERVFGVEKEAEEFVRILREVTERDGLSVFAWALMSNHYHLAVRTGAVSLDRPMRSLQQRVTRGVNLRRGVWGALWQGRYKAKLVESSKYLDQLLVYIHLNPVSAGIVDDPVEYRWSGHRDLLGKTQKPIVDVDEVLRVFGRTRRAARAAYVRRLKGAVEEEWIGEIPGRLPWWRLGRPPKGEEADPETTVRERRKREELGPDWRPEIEAGDFVSQGAEHLGVDVTDLQSSSKRADLVRARELLGVLGVERYRLKVKDLSRELRKTPDGMSQAIARGIRRRVGDSLFRKDLDELDRRLAGSGRIMTE